MRILNLGCGTKTSRDAAVINIDWSVYLRLKKNPVLRAVAPLILRGERLDRFRSLPVNVMVHNLTNGIPFDSDSVDAVYHSHVLEHFDRDAAKKFLLEVRRVLKPGGIQRIVVPDLEEICRTYLAHIPVCEKDPREAARHDSYIASLIEQSVRKAAHGTSRQKPFRRRIENLLLGDARKRGETHQWLYDRISLSALLIDLGYREPRVQRFNMSLIPGWNERGLDLDDQGREYKPASLYIEAIK